MPKRLAVAAMMLAALLFWTARTTRAQAPQGQQPTATAAQPQDDISDHVDGWNQPVPKPKKGQTPGPAPVHDISGTWEPAAGWRAGVQASGPANFPSDGKHAPPPFTPAGEAAWKTHKYGDGFGSYALDQVNDPFEMCDPIGFPRIDLHDLRAVEVVQTPKKVLMVYENDQVWRDIWTDGRDFPKNAEPRWYGYSIGKWEDPTTFVVQTTGLDTRTWIDNVGRPHTANLRVEERFHRVNHDIMEITVTITDPEYYTQPWKALDKYPMQLQPDNFDIREMVCSESEAAEYNKEIGAQAADSKDKDKK